MKTRHCNRGFMDMGWPVFLETICRGRAMPNGVGGGPRPVKST
jgi:hypothetical protein